MKAKANSLQAKAFLATIATVAFLAPGAGAASGAPVQKPHQPVCPGPASFAAARCHAHVVTDGKGSPQATTAPKGYGPAQLRGAYGLPAAAATAQTIGIVDAYNDPNIASDLNVYSKQFGLPQCNSSNPCFEKVNQSGSAAGPFPQTSSGWSLEIALDVEVAHAICPNCKILLVEATSNSLSNLAGEAGGDRDLQQLRRLGVLG